MIDNPGAISGTIAASVTSPATVKLTADQLTFARVPVGNIIFHDGKDRYKFVPQKDVTPYESVQLMIMFVTATTPSYYDYISYIKENNLERHFEKL